MSSNTTVSARVPLQRSSNRLLDLVSAYLHTQLVIDKTNVHDVNSGMEELDKVSGR